MTQTSLKLSRSFAWLNATQFFGALNDNVFKFYIIFFLIAQRGADSERYVPHIAGAVFVIPFLLFAAVAGVLADRYRKNRVIMSMKAMEMVIMTLGFLAFLGKSEIGLYAVLFLMALQSTIFGPSKYGVVPELVGTKALSRANGFLTAWTYLAIIIGTGLASIMGELTGGRYERAALLSMGIALTGFLCSVFIEQTPRGETKKKASLFFLGDIWRTFKSIRQDGQLMLAVMASAYFLLLGAFMQTNIIAYGIQVLDLTQERSGYLFLLAAIGIGAGALCAGKLSGRSVEMGIVPLGAFGLTLSCVLLSGAPSELVTICLLVVAIGFSSGLFIVPINAFIQLRSPHDRLGEILAASSFLSWCGVLVSVGLSILLGHVWGWSARALFLFLGVLTLVLMIVTFRVLPVFLLRFIGMIVTRICYRIRVIGLENVPIGKGGLLVSNHVSWVDFLLVNASQERAIRFIMAREIYDKLNRHYRATLDMAGVITVSFKDSPKKLIATFREARAAMDNGELVCVFAEGAITRSGIMREFRGGFERIVKGSDHPVIPVYIGGAWGSIFSYYHGKLLAGLPTSFPYPVTVIFGEHLPSTATAFEVRQAVVELSCSYFEGRKQTRPSIGEQVVRVARKHWKLPAMNDTLGKKLSYGQMLSASIAVRSQLKHMTGEGDKLGVLLPPSVAGSLINIATTLMCKVPVNLNYTASQSVIQSSIDQCGIKTVISSRAFLEKLESLEAPPGTVYVEDIIPTITAVQKLFGFFRARFFPARWIARCRQYDADQLATIIFSSGSTGDPKGVMLTHHNISSNIEGMAMIMRVSPADNICGALPFFHSFGYTGTIWFPLLNGFSVSYHANPIDGAKIAEVVRTNASTMLLATPTFLLAYIRRAKPEDFKTLRLVVTGAEKLKAKVADAFEEKFGLRPLEGYGATELSPCAACNVNDVEIDGVYQVGVKSGSVGHPLPGVAVRVVDPSTYERLGNDQEGLLLIKGPNVMKGYLNKPELTEEVIRDGWYVTGDIGRVDSDGFITITDRLSRFSKIGGEMVPHIGIEDAYFKGMKGAQNSLVVTAVPDERKGEKLVVLHTADAGTADELDAIIKAADIPNLWKPARNAYMLVEEIPILGTGKMDLREIKAIAQREKGAP